MTLTLDLALKRACAALAPNVLRPRLESEILLGFVLGVPRIFLHTHAQQQLQSGALNAFLLLIERRKKGEPLEYLTQRVSFYEHTFFITHGALIPRPESELLVQKVAKLIVRDSCKRVVEVGVGSGALLCSLALLFENVCFEGSDISESALAVAEQNLERFGLRSRVRLSHCAFLDDFAPPLPLVYANPPYIAADYPIDLPLCFEPHEALFGGKKGDEILLELLAIARAKQVQVLVCEMGYDQKPSVERALERLCARNVAFYQDYAGLWRGFVAEF